MHVKRIKVIKVFIRCWVGATGHKCRRSCMQGESGTNPGDKNR